MEEAPNERPLSELWEEEAPDYYAMGYDSCMAGNGDTPPGVVQERGPDAEASWNDGYNDCREEQEDDGA